MSKSAYFHSNSQAFLNVIFFQLAYVGSTPRGDLSAANFMDQYAGVYSYSPKTSYCVDGKIGKGYINFEWNKRSANMAGGWNPAGNLLMTVMPHQVSRT